MSCSPATQTGNRPAERTSFEIGIFGKYGIVIAQSPQRIDLHMTPGAPAANPPTAALTLGPPNDVVRAALELCKKLIAQPADVQRLAFGLTLGQSAASPADAVDIILRQVTSFSKGTSPILDLFIQINRPRQSKVDPQVELNRLCKWQAVQVQLIQVPVLGGVPSTATNAFSRAVVDIDINTSQNVTTIPGAKIASFFAEFADQAQEIALKGDVP